MAFGVFVIKNRKKRKREELVRSWFFFAGRRWVFFYFTPLALSRQQQQLWVISFPTHHMYTGALISTVHNNFSNNPEPMVFFHFSSPLCAQNVATTKEFLPWRCVTGHDDRYTSNSQEIGTDPKRRKKQRLQMRMRGSLMDGTYIYFRIYRDKTTF